MSDVLERRLANWMRPVTTTAGRISAVLEGLASLGAPTPRETLDLVLLAHGVAESNAAERLRAAVAEHDAGFVGDPVDVETQIVASAAVMSSLDGRTDTLVAVAVESASFCGLTPAVPELPKFATERLARIAEEWRERDSIPNPKTRANPFEDLDWSDGRAIGAADLQSVLTATNAAHQAWQKALRSAVDSMNERLRVADEELDLLSWTLAGRVDGDGEAYDEIGPAGAILAGLDVYDRLTYTTPIPGARGLLARVLGEEPVSLGAALDACGARLTESPVGERHRLTPVLFSLDDSVDVDGDPSWRLRVAKHQPVDVDLERPPADIAIQVIREQIISAAL